MTDNIYVQETVFEVDVTCGDVVVVGTPGVTGERGTIEIGTVTTVAPDQPATVENIGTVSDAILDFEIPRGSLVSVGTTSTVEYGVPASVTNSGVDGDSILNFSIPSGPISKVTEIRGRTTLDSAVDTVAINISGFTETTDILYVFVNSIYVSQGQDYTVSGANIVRSSGTWAVGTVIDFVCLRSILIPIESLPETSGQIKFPATQVSSSDANTLDDYEEGTWTPTIGADSGSGATYSSQIGKYVKIGDLVACECYLKLTSKGTLSGSVYLSSLPFEVDSAKNTASAITASGENLATNLVGIGFQPAFTTNLSGIKNINNTTAISVLTQSDLTNSTGFRLQFFYYST